jgi:hypothetical protein
MSNIQNAVIHAATNDELHLKLEDLFEAYHKMEKLKLKDKLVKEDMAAYALYIARCNSAIAETENIIKESIKYTEGLKLCLAS